MSKNVIENVTITMVVPPEGMEMRPCPACYGNGTQIQLPDELKGNPRYNCYNCNGAGYTLQKKDSDNG